MEGGAVAAAPVVLADRGAEGAGTGMINLAIDCFCFWLSRREEEDIGLRALRFGGGDAGPLADPAGGSARVVIAGCSPWGAGCGGMLEPPRRILTGRPSEAEISARDWTSSGGVVRPTGLCDEGSTQSESGADVRSSVVAHSVRSGSWSSSASDCRAASTRLAQSSLLGGGSAVGRGCGAAASAGSSAG